MKLQHFSKPSLSEEAEKIQRLGKALKKTPTPVVEAKKTDVKKDDVVDGMDEMREFAHEQLAKSNPLFHRKLKHHD